MEKRNHNFPTLGENYDFTPPPPPPPPPPVKLVPHPLCNGGQVSAQIFILDPVVVAKLLLYYDIMTSFCKLVMSIPMGGETFIVPHNEKKA